jgi:hypothetical protein
MRPPFDAEAVTELPGDHRHCDGDSMPSWPLLTAVVGPDIGVTD